MLKILIVSNTSWSLLNFRRGLIAYLIDAGFLVAACAPVDEYTDSLKDLVHEFYPIRIDTHGINPFNDIRLMRDYFTILGKSRPQVCLSYTIKPNVYCTLAANALSIPCINNIAGLGQVFVTNGMVTIVAKMLYKYALRRSKKIFFQNEDDMRLFVQDRIVSKKRIERIPGSGVCVDTFRSKDGRQPKSNIIRFSLISRLLVEKGVYEYVEAARIIKKTYEHAQFDIVGFVNGSSKRSVPLGQLEEWNAEGVVKYLGSTDDVRGYLETVCCVVLPTFYREGVPRILLESAAMCKPLITTDVVGCRDVVADGVNGYLCRPKDVMSLVECVEKIIQLTPAEREIMGIIGREKVSKEFDDAIVNKKYLAAIQQVVA